jgi:hypothetical protein
MITKIELNEDDIKQLIAEKFKAPVECVRLDATINKADRPYECSTKVVSALVSIPNTSLGSIVF